MNLLLSKALDPSEDYQFNMKHPRGFGGKFGAKPAQQVAQEEAQPEEEPEEEVNSEEVASGTSEQDAKVALSRQSAQRLRKDLAGDQPALVVVFGNRADATKFALACEHVMGSEVPLKVAAVANGKYHVEPEGMSAGDIDGLQKMIHARVPLSEMTRKEQPVDKQREPAAGANAGWETDARALLARAVRSGQVTEASLPEVRQMAAGIQSLGSGGAAGIMPVMEALHYRSLDGLRQASRGEDAEQAGRARAILDTMDLEKGGRMLLLKVQDEAEKRKSQDESEKHDDTHPDGKALPLGVDERVTDVPGEAEKITEPVAKYPRTGHVAKRRPRLIMSKSVTTDG